MKIIKDKILVTVMMTQWLEYMEGHERWWDAIWSAAAERGDKEVFIFWSSHFI